ncbi:hypothetical protein PHIN109289_04360 [Phaeobacter inhibens]
MNNLNDISVISTASASGWWAAFAMSGEVFFEPVTVFVTYTELGNSSEVRTDAMTSMAHADYPLPTSAPYFCRLVHESEFRVIGKEAEGPFVPKGEGS